MNMIESALAIALSAYAGKLDKAGEPYILHPLRVMAKMRTPAEMAVALLHDVIEDSPIGRDDLLMAGLSEEVVAAVEALSKCPHESYEAFIERVKANPLATRVKIADIEDNINILRLPALSDSDLQRTAKYHRAWLRLHA